MKDETMTSGKINCLHVTKENKVTGKNDTNITADKDKQIPSSNNMSITFNR